MTEFRTLSDSVYAAPQIAAEDFARAAGAGVTLVINNRFEGEAPDQIPDGEARALAEAAGLEYVHIPVRMQTLSIGDVEAMKAALDGAAGRALAYCASGTRSTALWALAEARGGADVDELIRAADAAGYDLSGLRPALQSVAPQGKA